MRHRPIHLLLIARRLVPALAMLLLLLILAPCAALAQSVVVMVNGDPITSFDVEQRIRLHQISTQRTPPRTEVIQELIDERLKIHLLRRYSIEGIDLEVDNAFAGMARRSRMTADAFAAQLARTGVNAATIKSRIKAEIVWSQVIRGRFQSAFQIGEKDILAKIEGKADDKGMVGYDYTLRPILFIVPQGSSGSAYDARRKEAEALRGRFDNCRNGIRLARSMRDVAVRQLVTRTSADLPPALREILEKTEVGRLTPPEIVPQGVEVHAVCGRRQATADNAPIRRQAREELAVTRFQQQAQRFLKELRSQAMIEYR